jgi:hypothetical protein
LRARREVIRDVWDIGLIITRELEKIMSNVIGG